MNVKDALPTKVYQKFMDGQVVQTAIIRRLPNGRYGFITASPSRAYEVNVNMPMFATPEEAKRWIESSCRWKQRNPGSALCRNPGFLISL